MTTISAADPAIPRLLDSLRRAHDGEAWHGPSLAEALHDVDARAAAARPIPDAHTVWELVLHLTAWTREGARRVDGATPAMPLEGDWPEPPTRADTAAWEDARRALREAHEALLAAVARLDPARLDERMRPTPEPGAPPPSDAALGVRHTVHGMLVGLAEHAAYHGGQIVLLARAAAHRAPP
jgi:uncharacterized damage-inducible protein DinB